MNIKGCSLLLIVHEYDKEVLEEPYCVKVEPKRLVDGVPCGLALGSVDELLHIVEGEGAEEHEASIEPDVEEGLARPEHVHE